MAFICRSAALAPLCALLVAAVLVPALAELTEKEMEEKKTQCIAELKQAMEEDAAFGEETDKEKMQECFRSCIFRKMGLIVNGELAKKKPKSMSNLENEQYQAMRKMCNAAVAKANDCEKAAALRKCIDPSRNRRDVSFDIEKLMKIQM